MCKSLPIEKVRPGDSFPLCSVASVLAAVQRHDPQQAPPGALLRTRNQTPSVLLSVSTSLSRCNPADQCPDTNNAQQF